MTDSEKRAAEADTRKCSKCGQIKPLSEFYCFRHKTRTAMYYQQPCKECKCSLQRKTKGEYRTQKDISSDKQNREQEEESEAKAVKRAISLIEKAYGREFLRCVLSQMKELEAQVEIEWSTDKWEQFCIAVIAGHRHRTPLKQRRKKRVVPTTWEEMLKHQKQIAKRNLNRQRRCLQQWTTKMETVARNWRRKC